MNLQRKLGPGAFSLLLAGGVVSADSLQCGGNVVGQGDTTGQLLANCGEPDSREGNRWTYAREGSIPRVVTVGNGVIMFIQDGENPDFSSPSPLGDHP